RSPHSRVCESILWNHHCGIPATEHLLTFACTHQHRFTHQLLRRTTHLTQQLHVLLTQPLRRRLTQHSIVILQLNRQPACFTLEPTRFLLKLARFLLKLARFLLKLARSALEMTRFTLDTQLQLLSTNAFLKSFPPPPQLCPDPVTVPIQIIKSN